LSSQQIGGGDQVGNIATGYEFIRSASYEKVHGKNMFVNLLIKCHIILMISVKRVTKM